MYDHPGTDCRTPVEGHKKNSVWCNNMSGSERNWTWKVGSLPVSYPNIEENKTSYTSELLCSSIVDPPQQATIIEKSNSGASNNYCCTEDWLVMTDIKDTHNGPTVQLPNNSTMNATNPGNIPLSGNISLYKKKAHIFDALNIALLIYLCQLWNNYCIIILDQNEMNILKDSKISLEYFWSNIHVYTGLYLSLSCPLLLFHGIYVSMVLIWVCTIIHMNCFYVLSSLF